MSDYLHNKIFTIGDTQPEHVNMPANYDMLLLPRPDAMLYENAGFTLSYKGMIADFGTGTYAEFLLAPEPLSVCQLNMRAHTRQQYNVLLGFSFAVEGRYMSFWTTTLNHQFFPVGYGPEVFPSMESLEFIGGNDALGNPRNYFHALNWGQAKYWSTTKRLILIFYDGFKKCFWTRPESVALTEDFRILRVNCAHNIPQIEYGDIDLITECSYMRMNKDEISFDFTTSAIVEARTELIEDVANYYDPWTEMPIIYPEDDS